MRVTTSLQAGLSAGLIAIALTSGAHAVSSRTYVSSTGSDANAGANCGRTTPCATFATAYSVTTAGGEIIALDVAGYGPVSITGAVTITGIDGALVNVVSNTAGITINAGASNTVILRGILVTGAAGSANTTGIKLNTGKVILQNAVLRNLTDGLLADSTGNSNSVIRAYVQNTDFLANTRAITTNGTGTDASGSNPPRGGNVEVLVHTGSILGNGTAFRMNNPGKNGNGNSKFPIYVANGLQTNVNIQGNTTVTSGSPTTSGGDCEFGCQVATYNPNAGQQDPDPTLSSAP